MVDETTIDGVTEDTPEVEEKKKGRGRGSGTSTRRRKKANKNEVTVPEVNNGFYHMFNFLAIIFRSKTVFDEKEFNDLAKAYVGLCNRFPILKMLVVIMAPLATIGELFRKIRALRAGIEKKPKKQTTVSVPVTEGTQYGTTGSGTFTS